MQISHLAIGNILLFDNTPSHVTALSMNMGGIVTAANSHQYGLKSGRIKPIRLAPEWLILMGFQQAQNGGYYLDHWKKNSKMDLIYSFGKIIIRTRWQQRDQEQVLPHIFHAHQVQNLFLQLTGTEIKIKNLNFPHMQTQKLQLHGWYLVDGTRCRYLGFNNGQFCFMPETFEPINITGQVLGEKMLLDQIMPAPANEPQRKMIN